MTWEQIQGAWTEARGHLREQWGKLTDDDLDVIAGQRNQLIGKLQQRYGTAKEDAERQVAAFERRFSRTFQER
jgi:uncharacterized protein YjbJ (UPF0337 family)